MKFEQRNNKEERFYSPEDYELDTAFSSGLLSKSKTKGRFFMKL
jgi:hypothetical protein